MGRGEGQNLWNRRLEAGDIKDSKTMEQAHEMGKSV
jgi:hypothetical protein